MAVHIKLIKNNIKSSSSYGKYFAKAVSQGEVTLKEIAEQACRNSGFSEGSVVGVVTELQDILKEKLSCTPWYWPFQYPRGEYRCGRPEGLQYSSSYHPFCLWIPPRRPSHPGSPYPLRPLRRSQGRLAERSPLSKRGFNY